MTSPVRFCRLCGAEIEPTIIRSSFDIFSGNLQASLLEYKCKNTNLLNRVLGARHASYRIWDNPVYADAVELQ